jgi:hypothetical protein
MAEPSAQVVATSTQVEEAKDEIRAQYRSIKARSALGSGRVWEFKVFWLFPKLHYLSMLDFAFRVVFPLAYAIFIVTMFSEVSFAVRKRPHSIAQDRTVLHSLNRTRGATLWLVQLQRRV